MDKIKRAVVHDLSKMSGEEFVKYLAVKTYFDDIALGATSILKIMFELKSRLTELDRLRRTRGKEEQNGQD